MSVDLLVQAARFGDYGVSKMLIKRGVDVNAKDIYSGTPLHWAAKNGHKKIVELFLKAGADVDPKGEPEMDYDWSSYMDYDMSYECDMCKYVNTPLHAAAENGHKKNSRITPKSRGRCEHYR